MSVHVLVFLRVCLLLRWSGGAVGGGLDGDECGPEGQVLFRLASHPALTLWVEEKMQSCRKFAMFT